jgi:serine/threonine protein kinase
MQHKETSDNSVITLCIDPTNIQSDKEKRILTALYVKYHYGYGYNRLYRFESEIKDHPSDRYFVNVPQEGNENKILTYKVHLTHDVLQGQYFYFVVDNKNFSDGDVVILKQLTPQVSDYTHRFVSKSIKEKNRKKNLEKLIKWQECEAKKDNQFEKRLIDPNHLYNNDDEILAAVLEKYGEKDLLISRRNYDINLDGKAYRVKLTNNIFCRGRRSINEEKQKALEAKTKMGNPEFRYDVAISSLVKPLGQGAFCFVHYMENTLQIIQEDSRKKARPSKEIPIARVYKMEILKENRHEREEQIKRLSKEGEMLLAVKQLHAKGIIKTDYACYFIMHHLPGDNLESIFKKMQQGKIIFDKEKRYELSKKLFHVLDELHQLGIIHCDIKPENIKVDLKLDNNGNVIEIGEVNIFDFNLSEWMDGKKSALVSDAKGTPRYMSAEAFDAAQTNSISYKSDIYSMGLVVSQIWNANEPRPSTWNETNQGNTYSKQCESESNKQSFINLCENIPDLSRGTKESEEIKSLMKSLVQADPKNIPEISVALDHLESAKNFGLIQAGVTFSQETEFSVRQVEKLDDQMALEEPFQDNISTTGNTKDIGDSRDHEFQNSKQEESAKQISEKMDQSIESVNNRQNSFEDRNHEDNNDNADILEDSEEELKKEKPEEIQILNDRSHHENKAVFFYHHSYEWASDSQREASNMTLIALTRAEEMKRKFNRDKEKESAPSTEEKKPTCIMM